ncbi:MAG: GDP-mannose 4,6-dehydratase [Chloroflexi bacterium]|nr:GDP-mannose 4,6-dehydratase [Chloroflexota bacterium]
MRALITGAGGFVGGYLCDYLLHHTDWILTGTVYPEQPQDRTTGSRLTHIYADLRDEGSVNALIEGVRPDAVFHLAAQSSVHESFSNPWDTFENNIRGELNLLEAIRRSGREVRFLVIGSTEEYGVPKPDELPQTEESPLRPATPYAVSKVAQDYLGLQYHLAYGLPVIRVRPFNHTGPRQSPRFVVPAFARQIAAIEAGRQEPVMKVGNLKTARDFVDVRDIVRAYHLAVMMGEPGDVYNLARGKAIYISDLLDHLLSLVTVSIEVKTDPSLYRPADVPIVYGSAEKFRQQTGWVPEIPFERTLQDVLDYWRAQIAAQSSD